MDDLLTQLGRQINSATEKILSPEEMENLKRDVQTTMQEAGNVVRDAAQAVREAGNSFRDVNQGYWNPPKASSTPPRQWKTASSPKSETPPAPPRQTSSSDTTSSAGFQNFQEKVVKQKKKKKVAPIAKVPGTGLQVALIIVGFLLILGNLSGFINNFLYLDFYSPISMIFDIGFSMIPLAIGGTLAFVGFHRIAYVKRFSNYRKQLKDVDYANIQDMAQFFSLPEDRIRKDLKQMMSEGLFRDCYFDEQQTCFILSQDVYEHYLALQENLRQKQLEAERLTKLQQENPEAAALEELRQTGDTYIQKIREINLALPEPEISAKLDSLEKVCAQIFDYIAKNPEKMPQIRKFMSYYLPTTLKLSEAFRDLELRAVQTDEIQNTKQEIREALDNINLAFQKLYANLMQKDLMGLSADISALETMLSQEGLIENDLQINGTNTL
ncbi:MAG: 5-bromo-4-chloroindolyl phosphate hydrolysis family protein [Candidatus Merdivicinus sp.]|jgi:5-bromo-4-chloroindolyl phosphate hydrolysis protein